MKRNNKGQFTKGSIPHNKGKNITETGKICASCKKDKPLSAFGKDKNRSDGLFVYCKECCKKKRKAYSEQNKEYMKQYYKENKAQMLKQSRLYYEENKDKILKKGAQYYKENKDKIRKIQKQWVENNREKSNAIKAAWKKRNPGKSHHYTVLRRMRIKNQIPDGADLDAIRNFYKNCPDNMEVDHIIPVSKGGLHCIDNLQYLTPTENRKKYNKIIA